MKKIILLAVLFANTLSFGQPEWAKIGTKWWYGFDPGTQGHPSGQGYTVYEVVSDSTVADTVFKKISYHTYEPYLDGHFRQNLANKVTDSGTLLMKNIKSRMEYSFPGRKFELDTTIRKNDIITFCGQAISIIDSGSLQINNKAFPFYDLSPVDTNLYFFAMHPNGRARYYINLGFNTWNLPAIFSNKAVYCVKKPLYLRCFSQNGVTYKFTTIPCDSIGSQKITFRPNPNSISDSVPDLVSIYPNPFNDFLKIEHLSIDAKSSMQLFDYMGNIMEMDVDGNDEFNTKALPIGIYLLKISNKNRFKIYKLIKL